jgi:N-acetylglutamate synthase-like GNAT family acetyltransferase
MASLNDWLCKQALRNEVSGVSRTYVVCQRRKIIAFYSFTTGSVTCCGRVSSGADEPDAIPVIVLARLAVDMQWQGRGVGFGLLKNAVARSLYVARKIDIHAIVVHTLNEQVKNFFARYGFTELTLNPMVLTLPRSEGGKKLLPRNNTEKIFTTASLK